MWPLHIYVVVTLAANTNAKNISTHCAQRGPQAVHKLQSKSQTNALEPHSAALAFVSVSLALESCVLNTDPPCPSSSRCATPLAKMFCWHAKVRSLRWPLCHSLCQMLATYQLSCDRGVAGRGAATSCEVR